MSEKLVHIIMVSAIAACCLLLLIILGGTFGSLGIFLKKNWLIVLGLIIIVIVVISIVVNIIKKWKK